MTRAFAIFLVVVAGVGICWLWWMLIFGPRADEVEPKDIRRRMRQEAAAREERLQAERDRLVDLQNTVLFAEESLGWELPHLLADGTRLEGQALHGWIVQQVLTHPGSISHRRDVCRICLENVSRADAEKLLEQNRRKASAEDRGKTSDEKRDDGFVENMVVRSWENVEGNIWENVRGRVSEKPSGLNPEKVTPRFLPTAGREETVRPRFWRSPDTGERIKSDFTWVETRTPEGQAGGRYEPDNGSHCAWRDEHKAHAWKPRDRDTVSYSYWCNGKALPPVTLVGTEHAAQRIAALRAQRPLLEVPEWDCPNRRPHGPHNLNYKGHWCGGRS